ELGDAVLARLAFEVGHLGARALVGERDAERERAVLVDDFTDFLPAFVDRVMPRRVLLRARLRRERVRALDRLRAIRAARRARVLEATDPRLEIGSELLSTIESVPEGHRHARDDTRGASMARGLTAWSACYHCPHDGGKGCGRRQRP